MRRKTNPASLARVLRRSRHKAGIDIRLRRKITNEKDEITDIRLVPDADPSNFASYASKSGLTQELPAPNSLVELADTACATELDASQHGQPSRSSTISALGEPLPRYEREPRARASLHVSPLAPSEREAGATTSTGVTPLVPFSASVPQETSDSNAWAPAGHRRPSSQSSIVPTPRRGLSLRDAGQEDSVAKGEPNRFCGFAQGRSGRSQREA